jgi:L-cystine uptake protein TcyP (sodium:dicarboxylate symporter family)
MKMKRIAIIILALIWITCLIILIIALTDIVPNNPFQDYRLIEGIAFLVLSSFIGIAYKKLLKAK